MDADRWRKIEDLYNAVVSCESIERVRLLAEADPEIKKSVELMLVQDGSLLDHPVWSAKIHPAASWQSRNVA